MVESLHSAALNVQRKRGRDGREECENWERADFFFNHQAVHKEDKKGSRVIKPISASKDEKPHHEIKEWQF